MKPTPPEIVRRSLLSVDHDATPAYRLLVRVGRHDLIFDAPPFAHYKQAMAHVATAVRAHAPRGHVQAVILQRRRPPNGHNGGPVHHADRPWIDVMSWDGDVTARILRQANHAAPDRPAPRVHWQPAARLAVPPPSPHDAPNPPPSVPRAGHVLPRLPRPRPRRHRWHLAATALLLLATWVCLALLVTDGHPARLLDGLRTTHNTGVPELPFDAPRTTGRGNPATAPAPPPNRRPDVRPASQPVP